MIIIPKEKPVLENLNSYYLNLEKLCEHFQGEIGSGCIYFNSPEVKGLIFFDKDEILNGLIEDKNGPTSGIQTSRRLFDLAGRNNFSVNVYQVETEGVYFWSSIPSAEKIYSDLSTEFTDLNGLIKKMESEKLTGYIDVSIGKGEEGGILFFNIGESVGGSYSWGTRAPDDTRESQELLIRKTKEFGGTFDVSRIPPPNKLKNTTRPAKVDTNFEIIPALEEFLSVFESYVSKGRKAPPDFSSFLKRKFVEKADKFPFLDPFLAEFEFSNQKIFFTGDVGHEKLAEGVLECGWELVEEIGSIDNFKEVLDPWLNKYTSRFSALGISF